MSLSSAEAEFYALTTGIVEGMVTTHLLQELRHEVILIESCRQSVCKSMGIQARTGKNEKRDVETHVCARRSGEKVDESRTHHEAEQSRFDDKVSHI